MRRARLLAPLVALSLAACGGAPSPEQAERAAFLERYGDLSDRELARLCPSLYPADFLSKPDKYDKYGYSKPDPDAKPRTLTAADRAAARAAGCSSRGTKPED